MCSGFGTLPSVRGRYERMRGALHQDHERRSRRFEVRGGRGSAGHYAIRGERASAARFRSNGGHGRRLRDHTSRGSRDPASSGAPAPVHGRPRRRGRGRNNRWRQTDLRAWDGRARRGRGRAGSRDDGRESDSGHLDGCPNRGLTRTDRRLVTRTDRYTGDVVAGLCSWKHGAAVIERVESFDRGVVDDADELVVAAGERSRTMEKLETDSERPRWRGLSTSLLGHSGRFGAPRPPRCRRASPRGAIGRSGREQLAPVPSEVLKTVVVQVGGR